MDKIKGVAEESPVAFNNRQRKKRNWWDDEDETFESKWMTGPAAGNANGPNPMSLLNQAKTDKDAILISQQNLYDGQTRRAVKTNPYAKKEPGIREHNGEQFTFAFIADPKVDTEV